MAAYLIANHPAAVERVWGEESLGGVAMGRRQAERVDAARVEQMRGLVRRLPPLSRSGPRNPPAVFVLAPPRSGTTLMRVLLGGHPRLFAPPELELLSYNTLAERRATYTGRDAFWLEGLVRAVMEIRGCTAEEATETIAVWEDEGWTAKQAYGQLQAWLGERILVDKTPSYALDSAILERAEEDFEEPLYVHLVRHPNGMIRSFEEAKLDQLFFRREHPFERRELAELIWQVSQENILRFLEQVPEKRKHLVRFEELVRDPEPVLRRLCDFLDLDFDPAMLRPYEDRSRRMTDGVHAESRMLGDVKFHTHSGIDAGTAESWRRELSEESLGEPTRAMAERLGYSMPVAAASWTAIPRLEVEPGTPQAVSFAQERFWFLNRMDDTQAGSIILAAVRLVGDLRQDALSAALDEVARRHGSLRTRFAEQGGRPVQIVLPAGPVSLPRIDLTALPAAEAEAETRRLAGRELLRPFDLTAGRLLRVLLVPLPGGDHALLVFLHHIVADGWSVGVFLREMGALYQAYSAGTAAMLPALPVQYTDFARWQREELRGERLETEVGYWRRRLAGLPALDLPVDRQAGSEAVSEKDFLADALADAVTVALPGELASRLRALAHERGATMFMTLLAAFHALLARHTGQDDVAVGSPIAGRNRAETEGLIGLFVNTLVLRGDLSGAPTFADLLERERQSTLGAFGHQDLPFALLVEALRPERRRGRYPFAEVLFSLQNQPIPKLEMPGLTLARLWSSDDEGDGEVRTAFPLSLMLWESGGTVQGGLGFNSALFDRATAERWRDNLMTLLAAMAERPAQPISEVPLLSVGERRQVVAAAPAAEPERPAAVSEDVAKQRAELSSRRGQLSAAKRELLEKRLRGQAKAAAPAAARAAEPKILVPLQAGHGHGKGSRPPFFCVHAIGGSVFSYGELARALGPEQAFYGVQSPGLDGGPLFDDVPAMAAEYVAAILDAVPAAAPGGPLVVGGWSFGGVVAFEMARQLRARGREIPLVVLLDSYAPTGADLLAERSDAELLRPILLDQAGLQGRGAEWLDDMPMAGEEAVIRMLEQARAAGVLRADVQAGKVERLLGVYKANLRALSSYRPQPYGGRVLLLRSEGAEARRPANGWEGLAGEPIEVQSVSGDHYSMLAPPHVVHLANRLAGSLERALRAGAPTEAEAMA
ncbi:MAG: condensation domain-containing protein [Thermoanaerobaculia bacterium]